MNNLAIESTVQTGLNYFFIQWVMLGIGVLGVVFGLGFLLSRPSQFALAARNVLRNKRRSLITLLAVTAAVCGNVLIGTYFLQMFLGLREWNIRSQTGHLQLMLTDFYEKGGSNPTEYLITNSQEIIDALQADSELMQYTDLITTQARFNGLITAGDRSINFLGNAVEPAKDRLFSSSDIYVDGLSLDESKPYEIVLGEGLAQQLSVGPGDSVSLLGTLAGGGLNVLDATVRGTIRPLGKEYSDVVVKTSLQFAQEMLYTSGVNRIILLLTDTEDTEAAKARVAQIVQAHPEWGLQLYDWYQLQDFYRQVVSFFSNIFTVVSALLFFLVIFLVLNTMTMSVFERFNEFGTLRSIGVKKGQLVNMVLIEGVLLGFWGAVLGLVLSKIVGIAVTNMGIVVSPPPGQVQGYPLVLTPDWSWETIKLMIISSLASIGMAFLSSFFPAHKASRLKIVDCLRHNQHPKTKESNMTYKNIVPPISLWLLWLLSFLWIGVLLPVAGWSGPALNAQEQTRRLKSGLSDAEYSLAKTLVTDAENFRGYNQQDFFYQMEVIDTLAKEVRSNSELDVHVNTQQSNAQQRDVLVKITSGNTAGNIMLQRGANMWFYKPGTAQAFRISAAQRLLGGASYADVSSTNYSLFYDPVGLTETTLAGSAVYDVTLEKVEADVAYSTIHFFIAKGNHQPVKSEFYTPSGKLLKTMYFRDFGRVGAKDLTREWVIVDGLNNDAVTFIRIRDIQPQAQTDAFFSVDGMKNF